MIVILSKSTRYQLMSVITICLDLAAEANTCSKTTFPYPSFYKENAQNGCCGKNYEFHGYGHQQ